jgi:membrane protease YdiL (CAAX protease family)
MSAQGVRLSDSAFLANVDQRDRSVWRFLGTVFGGLVGGLICGLLVGGIALVAFAFATAPPGMPLAQLAPHVAALVTDNGASMASTLMLMMLAVTTNGPLAVAFICIAAVISRHRIGDYLTAARSFRWPLLACGLVLSVIVIGPVVAVSQLMDPHAGPIPILTMAPDWLGRIGYAFAAVALLIPAAAAEEVVFRGWLLRQTAALTRNVIVLMVVNGVLFSAIHGEFAVDAFLTRALMGAGFVYMTLRLGGIEFSTGAHAANNILIVLFIQPLSIKPTASAGLTPDSLFQDIFLFAAYVGMAELTARWGPLRRLSGADQTLATPAIAAAEHFA